MSDDEKRKAEIRTGLGLLGVTPEAMRRLGLRAVILADGIEEASDLMDEDEMILIGQCGNDYLIAEMSDEGGEG